MTIEAMKQALEHVQEFKRRWWAVPPFGNKVNKATREAVSAAHSPIFQLEDTIRAAIEKAELIQRAEEAFSVSEQKPVAWMWSDGTTTSDPDRADGTWTPLYTAPRQWQGLTDEEIVAIELNPRQYYDGKSLRFDLSLADFARAIEAKLKEKNT
jgi:hypothetical protein